MPRSETSWSGGHAGLRRLDDGGRPRRHRRGLVQDRRPADPPRARGGRRPASGWSTWPSSSRRWVGCRSPGPTLIGRAGHPGRPAPRAERPPRLPGRGATTGAIALDELGHGDLVDRIRTRATPQRALAAHRDEAGGARRAPRRLGAGGGAHRARDRHVRRGGAAGDLVPTWDRPGGSPAWTSTAPRPSRWAPTVITPRSGDASPTTARWPSAPR